jgi:hypothetical protein
MILDRCWSVWFFLFFHSFFPPMIYPPCTSCEGGFSFTIVVKNQSFFCRMVPVTGVSGCLCCMNLKNKASLTFYGFSCLGLCFFLSFIPYFFQAIISSCGWTPLFGFASFPVLICNSTNIIFFCHSLLNSVLRKQPLIFFFNFMR